jgi:predicted nucleic acid-binding protein
LRFVETNIFLYVITANPEFGPAARRILERIWSGEEAVTSSLAIAEVAWLEYRKKTTYVATFLSALNSYLTLQKSEHHIRRRETGRRTRALVPALRIP